MLSHLTGKQIIQKNYSTGFSMSNYNINGAGETTYEESRVCTQQYGQNSATSSESR